MSGVEAPKLYPKVNLKGGKMNSVIRLLEVGLDFVLLFHKYLKYYGHNCVFTF